MSYPNPSLCILSESHYAAPKKWYLGDLKRFLAAVLEAIGTGFDDLGFAKDESLQDFVNDGHYMRWCVARCEWIDADGDGHWHYEDDPGPGRTPSFEFNRMGCDCGGLELTTTKHKEVTP